MDLLDVIKSRRSIRRYTKAEVNNDVVEKIIEAGMYAPSAVNKQPWHFIVFNDKEQGRQIMEVHPNARMVIDSSKNIVVCIDEDLQHDDGYGIQDCSAAIENMLLAAHSLGLGACWMGIYPREKRVARLKKIFQLPDHITPLAVISLGYPNESKEIASRFKPERIHYKHW